MPPPPPRPRARDLGLEFGAVPTGPHDAITDVPGVRVGQVTVWNDPTPRAPGRSPAPVPRRSCSTTWGRCSAGRWRRALRCSTAPASSPDHWRFASGASSRHRSCWCPRTTSAAAYDAVVDAVLEAGIDDVVIPVVGECDDSSLDDIRARSLSVTHVRRAIDTASDGAVAEGVVGAGCGMITMGHKAGIGTASRVVGDGTVGVLLLCNFGGARLLRVGGMHVGPRLEAHEVGRPGAVGTAPARLRRLVHRRRRHRHSARPAATRARRPSRRARARSGRLRRAPWQR